MIMKYKTTYDVVWWPVKTTNPSVPFIFRIDFIDVAANLSDLCTFLRLINLVLLEIRATIIPH